jgi:hypothetical protein
MGIVSVRSLSLHTNANINTPQAMRGTAIRGHTLGVSFGNPLSIEPSLGTFNPAAYEAIDFAIAAARVYGIKLLIPLVDNVGSFFLSSLLSPFVSFSPTLSESLLTLTLDRSVQLVPRRQIPVHPMGWDPLQWYGV